MLGLATGNSIVGIVTSAIVPSLIADAGWSKAQFAALGSLSILSALAMPVVGRLADTWGVRLTALIGLICVPLVYLAYSFCGGSLQVYAAIYAVQITICITTSSTVYTRLVVQNVDLARGLALALVASSPAVAGMVGGPVLNGYVEAHGWQASFRALALFVACTGVVTFLLIPPDRPKHARPVTKAGKPVGIWRKVLTMPAFWYIGLAMLFCNLPQALMLTQLKLLVMDQGVSGKDAAVMFSALSGGMLAGRIVTGVALDRFSPHWAAFICLGLPGLGLFILASPLDAPGVILGSIFFLGFAFGAEGDVIAYLVSRHFEIRFYSTVMGLITAIIALSSALGSIILGMELSRTGSFVTFLLGTGAAVFLGAGLLLRLGACPLAAQDRARA